MARIPDLVTHLYHPAIGPCRNLCSLPDIEASRVLDRLREHRPTLKPDYLARRHSAERWLWMAASTLLGRSVKRWPTYFFLGDFSHVRDDSRPSALMIPLASLPNNAITFTLGDSMKVAEERMPRLYKLAGLTVLFNEEEKVAEFGLTDESGVQSNFIEMQLWGCASRS